MPPEEISASARTAAALAQLQPIAKQVTEAAEQLTRPIATVDEAIKRLHIAYEAWVTYRFSGEEPEYNNWQIGYSRHQGRWGICLRVAKGNMAYPNEEDVETWHFNESPIFLRHRSVDKLPDLIEALVKTGEKVANKLSAAASRAGAIAQTMAPAPKAKK